MTTLEMEVALMQHINIRRNLCVPNVSWGISDTPKRKGGDGDLHECDLLFLTPQNLATEIEIKISLIDLKKESKKKHTHEHRYISRLYFAVPEDLRFDAEKLAPERAGVLYVTEEKYTGKMSVHVLREAKINTTAHKWTDAERYKLARLGSLRILSLKQNILKLK